MKLTWKISGLLVFGILSLLSGWWMWQQNARDQLWGYLPLLHFICLWGVIQFIRIWKWPASDPAWKFLGWSTLTGFLLALGFPPLFSTPVLFVAFVPLLWVEDKIFRSPTGKRKVFGFAYHTFVLWNILTTFWVANTAFVAGIVAIWLNALLMTIPFFLFHKTRKYLPRLGYLSFIAYWMSFEMVHLNWELSWSWLNLGNAFAQYPQWIQWYEYSGVMGGTLWVLLANVLFFQGIKNWIAHKQKPSFYQWLGMASLVLLPIGISLVRWFQLEDQGRPVEVVVVQPNYEPHYQKFVIPDSIQVKHAIELAAPLMTSETRFVLLPETSFGLVELSQLKTDYRVGILQNFLKNYPEASVVTGIDSYKILSKDEPSNRFTRTMERPNRDTMRYEMYNGAIQISPQAESEIPHYQKSKLVPGPEVFPFKTIFFFFQPIVEKLGGSTSGLATQKRRSHFSSAAGKVAPVICYESVFGEYLTGYINQGAEAIFIMTNDGWWDDTPGHMQHLLFGRLRAIETRKSVARSANTGISAFINQKGEIQQGTKYGVDGAVRGTVLFNNHPTFYMKWGDFLGRIACFLAIILLLNLLSRFFTRSS